MNEINFTLWEVFPDNPSKAWDYTTFVKKTSYAEALEDFKERYEYLFNAHSGRHYLITIS